MKILAGHHGLRGDLAINVPALEFIKEHSGHQIDMPINRQFADMVPLFLNHPAFNVVVTDGYNNFPTERDKALIKARCYVSVLNPMQPHRDEWWQFRHQTSAVLFDYANQELPLSRQQINLVKWFDVERHDRTVAFAPFAAYAYNQNNDKMLSVQMAQKIVNYLVTKGYSVLQIGGANEPQLNGATLVVASYFNSVRAVLGCKFLLHTDTGMGWIASGYKHPQLGLYGHRYYGADKVKNIQPINPNGVYLDATTVAEIPLETIFAQIDLLLENA